MNQSEMILEFIDGTLDGGREQRLFDEMAQHPELRAELRQYVMIGDAVRADREAYSPPADVERRLLGGLGILPLAETGGAAAGAALGSAAGGTTAAASATAGGAGLFGWLGLVRLKSALIPLVVGIVLGVAVGGGGVYLAVGDGGDSGPTVRTAAAGKDGNPTVAGADRSGSIAGNGSAAVPEGGSEPKASASPSSTSAVKSSANALQANTFNPDRQESNAKGGGGVSLLSSSSSLSSKSSNRNSEEDLSAAADGGTARERSRMSDTENPVASELQSVSPDAVRSVGSGALRPSGPLVDANDLLPTAPEAQRSPALLPAPTATDLTPGATVPRFTLELRKGILSQPFADNNARQVSGDFLSEDIVAGGFYSPDEKWYFGIEGGRERFAQSLFYNRDDTLFVEQRPAVAWGGAVLGRKLSAFDIPFFVQGTMGASQYGGPIARGRVGLDVMELLGGRAPSAFSIPFSFEASSLVYTYNGQYLVTGNWGFSGGVRLRFGL